MAEGIDFKRTSLTSYDHDPSERCWFDDCNCDDIPVADCDALIDENNRGIGRFACRAEEEDCYNKKFMASFLKKLACQLNHYIENICGLWDMVECMREYLKTIGDYGNITTTYSRNSAVSSSTFYHPITDEYDLSLYMDSTTGVVNGESDDKRRKQTDRKYRAYIRWCADGNGLNPAVDNTMTFTVYHSGEQLTDDMVKSRSVHWQMTGVSDGAMEMSDTIIVPKGQHIKVRVQPANQSSGTFRVHQFKVEYTPVMESADLPECLQDEPVPEKDCYSKAEVDQAVENALKNK